MSNLRVLIVGASTAGTSTAYWFAKAGANVTIIERYPNIRTNGHNIDIRTSGVTIMRKIPDLETTVRAKRLDIQGLCLVRAADGKPYGTIQSTGNPDQQSLLSEYEILRGHLVGILYDLTKTNKNIRYVFHEQVVSIEESRSQNGGVLVGFLNGLDTNEYDLVVACDGAMSRTRAIGFGCNVRDHVTSTNCWAAYFSTKLDLISKKDKLGYGSSSVPGRFLSVEPYPDGGNMVQMIALRPSNGGLAEEDDKTASFRKAVKKGDSSLKQYLATYFKGHGWKTEDVLEALRDSDDLYASEIVRVKVPSLSKGRIVLVGDAGYAPGFTGTGTTLAMTGAYVLAGEICKHGGDIEAGLAGYEKTMRPMITEMSWVPPLVPTFLAPQTAWGLWLRNTVFALFAWSGLAEYAQKVSGWFSGDGSEYPLPEYPWVA